MTELVWACALFALLATLLHLASALLALYRLRGGPSQSRCRLLTPRRSACCGRCAGLIPFDELTLRSGFELDYPRYRADPVLRRRGRSRRRDDQTPDGRAPRCRRAAAHRQRRRHVEPQAQQPDQGLARRALRLGRHGRQQRAHAARLSAAVCSSGWRSDTGLLCAPPIGGMPQGFWAEVECAFLNTYQARWQYAADTRRPRLRARQDHALAPRRSGAGRRHPRARRRDRGGCGVDQGRAARRAGACASSIARFGQPLGRRSAAQVWSRQARWAKLRRATFPLCFLPEILSGSLAPMLAAAYAAQALPMCRSGPNRRALAVSSGTVRGAARPPCRLAHRPVVAARLGRARPDAAGVVDAGLARQDVQLAWKRHEPCRCGGEQLSGADCAWLMSRGLANAAI